MQFGYWTHNTPAWKDVLELCRGAEATGWDGVWHADHFMPNAEDNSGPANECWTTLTAIAALVPRVRVGHLVNSNTYRNPAVLAKMAAGVDIISGGRFVLGLGAGWQENEHESYGITLPSLTERMDRLEEAAAIVKSLLSQERTTFEGRYYQIQEAPLAPKPVQTPLPLLIGGGGERRTLRIVARFADEWNDWGTPEQVRRKAEVFKRHCTDVGRDPAEIRRSAATLLAFGTESPAIERAQRMNRPIMSGSTEDVRRTVQAYAAAGIDELIVADMVLGGVEEKKETLERFITEVGPEFR